MDDVLIQPTDEERRNGWTAETLTAYVKRQSDSQRGVIFFDPAHRKPSRPKMANGTYNPHRCWG
jgi:hypothetical protein